MPRAAVSIQPLAGWRSPAFRLPSNQLMTTTLIAKRTRVDGLIETEGDVMIEGRVEGTIRAAGCVTVAVSGVAVSDMNASRALVLGILIGNVSATERIDVAA